MKILSLNTAVIFPIGLGVGLYTAFIAECFWNWFAVPVIHVAEISFLQMLGILWLTQMLVGKLWNEEDKRWKMLASAIELCVPEERKQALANLINAESLGEEAFVLVFSQLAGNTLMLALGFVLHLLTS